MVAIGLLGGAFTLIWLGQLNLNAGYWDIFWPQFFQGLALSALFVPLTTISMAPIPRERMGNATSLFNLMRNLGGSVGIAVTGTMLSRNTQAYVNVYGANVDVYSPATQRAFEAARGGFIASGSDPVTATQRAYGALFGMVQQQASIVSFVGLFRLLGVIFLLLLPLVLLMKRPRGGGPQTLAAGGLAERPPRVPGGAYPRCSQDRSRAGRRSVEPVPDGAGCRISSAEGVPRMTLERDEAQSAPQATRRNPSTTLRGCQRILILGRTGSGKTTLARELAAAIDVPHVELDALYFGPGFSTVALPVLRERTIAAIAGERWVTDGNKSAVRDLVWPRADTVVWLDYPVAVSLWRLGEAGALAHLGAQDGGLADGREGGAAQAAALGREGRAHSATVPPGATTRLSDDVRRAAEPAPRRRTPAVTASHPALAGPRRRVGPRVRSPRRFGE